jgi:hypothetical protein
MFEKNNKTLSKTMEKFTKKKQLHTKYTTKYAGFDNCMTENNFEKIKMFL